MDTIAAVCTAVILGGVAVMQLALAFGAPWGAHVYGGRVADPGEALPTPYRAASLAAVGLLLVAGWIVLARAGVVTPGLADSSLVVRGTWIVAGYLVLNTLANLASSSPIERWVQGTATFVAAVLTVLVARS